MKRVYPEESWPDSWKYSYPYDLEEIYGATISPGYASAYRLRRTETLRLIEEVLPKNSSILDMGAAQGNFSLALAELGHHVTWNDLRADLADYVRLKYEYGDISYAPGNAFELNFAVPFDGVLITEIIEHVAHPDDFLRKCAQLVKPGGVIIMTTPNGAYFRNHLPKFSDCADPSAYESVQFKPNSDGHIFLLHPEEVGMLADRAGLVLEKRVLFMNPLSIGHVKTALLLRILPQSLVRGLETLTQHLPWSLQRKFLFQMAAVYRRAK